MYTDIGDKIKGFARIMGILSLLAGLIAWIYFITNGKEIYWRGDTDFVYIEADDYIGWLSLVAGAFGFFSSWITYGFGLLVDKVNEISFYVKNSNND